MPVLRTLFIRGTDPEFTINTRISTVIISNPKIVKIELYQLPFEVKFSFPSRPSKLRQLSIHHSSLSAFNFESIPDALHRLTLVNFSIDERALFHFCIDEEQIYKDEDIKHAVKLPTRLRALSIEIPRRLIIPTFTNIEQLFDLEKVSLDYSKRDFEMPSASILKFRDIENFISRLPSHIWMCSSLPKYSKLQHVHFSTSTGISQV
ncbi:unnamed protein product [Ambrosiozyma monospora]|uniref:Unnamed protein product n=1 Tax=Ambrosiozyma monospora TaxID=43982 RepID=A0A9W7DP74_AMBMO|nr:unnamed protein product [Ambrosiozyma monospora]